MKPIIGIIEWPYLDKENRNIYEIRIPLIDWIIKSGGKPVGLFPSNVTSFIDKKISDIPELNDVEKRNLYDSICLCDAIIKPGASRIYEYERKIYEYCYKDDIPYLGICAGMQTMASYGKENIENENNNSKINHNSEKIYAHKILLEKLTLLKSMLGKDEIVVNSLHNYHIKDSGIHKINAYSEDNIIEGIESKDNSFHLGLQWHPELLPKDDQSSIIIFGELIESAKKYKKKKL